jgi:hypothetical protein
MKLYISTNEDGTDSLVTSAVQNTKVEIPTLFNGDSIPLEIQFVDGQGNIDFQFNAENISSVKVAIGDVDDSIIVAFVESLSFVTSSNTWNGTLVLSTESMASQLLGSETKTFHFEVQVVKTSGENITILQKSVNVRNQLIESFTSGTTNPTYPAFSNHILDPFGTPSSGDAIKILSDFENNSREFKTNQIFISSGYFPESETIKLEIEGNEFFIGKRSVRWELLNLISDVTNPYADTDGDGTPDNSDAFPNDPSETTDSDADGIGDNADAFPNDSSETTDSDADGVGDNTDAFPSDPSVSVTQEELNSYVLNPTADIVVGSVIIFLQDVTKVKDNGQSNDFATDEIHPVTGVLDDWIAVTISNTKFWTSSEVRGIEYELMSDPSQVDVDSDSDGILDSLDYFPNDSNYTQTKSELDAYALDPFKSFAVGDIFKILQDFTTPDFNGINDIDLKDGDYYIITEKGNHWIRFYEGDSNIQLYDTPRGIKWEIVNPSDQVTPDPNTDTDGDGTPDNQDAFPNDPSETTDSDGDGVGDNADVYPNDSTASDYVYTSSDVGRNVKVTNDQYRTDGLSNGNVVTISAITQNGLALTWSGGGEFVHTDENIKWEFTTDNPNFTSTPIDVSINQYGTFFGTTGFVFDTSDYSIWNDANLNNIANPEFHLQQGQSLTFTNNTDTDPFYLFYKTTSGAWTALRDPNNNNNPIVVIGKNTGASGTPWIKTIQFDLNTDYMYNTTGHTSSELGYIRIST